MHSTQKLLKLFSLVVLLSIKIYSTPPQFTPHVIIETEVLNPTAIHSCDLDNDGKKEIVIACSINNYDNYLCYYKDIDGTPEFHYLDSNANFTNSIFSADLDNDGDLDVMTTGVFYFSYPNHSGNIQAYENDNMKFIQHAVSGGTSEKLHSVITATDINGDSLPDLIVSNHKTCKYWFKNNGDFTFEDNFIFNEGNQSRNKSLKCIDFDKDGDNDVLMGPGGWLNNTETGLKEVWDFSGDYYFPFDLDKDGDIDVLSGAFYAGTDYKMIAWDMNDGNMNFERDTVSVDISHISNIFGSDMNKDGFLDIIYSSSKGKTIGCLLNDGQNNFKEHYIIDSSSSDGDIYTIFEDFNGDDKIDIIIADHDSSELIYLESNENSYDRHIISKSGYDNNYGSELFVVDYNQDGYQDFITSSSKNKKISYFENSRNNNFIQNDILDSVLPSNYLQALDLNNDNKIDIITNGYSEKPPNSLMWYKNNGSYFSNHTILEKYIYYPYFQCDDLNRDSLYDIIILTYEKKIEWYKNNGDETFTLSDIGTCNESEFFKVIDFDNDNNTDIIFYDTEVKQLLIFKNDGDQNFSLDTLLSGFTHHLNFNFDFVDFNYDNKMDLLTSDVGRKIEYHINNGDNTFKTDSLQLDIIQPNYIKCLDIDRDGDYDILASKYDMEEIHIFENNGNFNFEKTTFPFVKTINSMAVSDFDNDEDLDFIVKGQDKIAYFENKLPQTKIIKKHLNMNTGSTFKIVNSYINYNFVNKTELNLINVSVYNLQGRLILHKNIRNPRPVGNINLNINNYAKGLYFIRVSTSFLTKDLKFILK